MRRSVQEIRTVALALLVGLAFGYLAGSSERLGSSVAWGQQGVFRGETAAVLRRMAQTVERIAAATERIDGRLARLERAGAPEALREETERGGEQPGADSRHQWSTGP